MSKTLFIRYPIPKFVKKKFFSKVLGFFIYLKISEVQNPEWFGKKFPEICFHKFTNFGLPSEIYIKIKDLDYLTKS